MSGNYNDRYSVLGNKKSNNSTTKCGSNLNSFSKAKTALTAKVTFYFEMDEWTVSKNKRATIPITSPKIGPRRCARFVFVILCNTL